MKIQGTILTAARGCRRSAVLLRAVNPIRKSAVHSHVIELPRRLVVPTAPSLAAVSRDHRALVASQNHALWLVGGEPPFMIIVAPSVAPAHPSFFPALP